MITSMLSNELEDKYFDTVLNAGFNIDYNGGTPFSLSDVPQGITDTNRTGDSLLAKRLSWAVFVRYNQISTITNLSTSSNVVRLVVFRWKPFYSDVAPTVSKVLTYFGTFYAADAPLSHDGRDQFDLIADQTIVLDGQQKIAHQFRGSVTLNSKVQYKAASTTNQASGYYAFMISDALAGGGVYPNVLHYAFRLDFQDA